MKKQAAHIINKFGGVNELHKLSHFPINTIRSWAGTGLIPVQHHTKLIDLAIQNSIRIEPKDFFPDVDFNDAA